MLTWRIVLFPDPLLPTKNNITQKRDIAMLIAVEKAVAYHSDNAPKPIDSFCATSRLISV
jgi:hypothetical protein